MNKTKLLVILLILCACAAGGYFFFQNKDEGTLSQDMAELTPSYMPKAEESTEAQEPAPQSAEEQQQEEGSFDVAAALENRIMGDPNAPIKISEHSSFTCPHCAHFHIGTLPKVKKELIDTGKAYWVFMDFPLNAPALHASMIARCIPDKDRYFDFVNLLFENYEDWAYENKYLKWMEEQAKEYGLDKKAFKACLNNEDLQEGLAAIRAAAQSQWDINSTPSFVINNTTTISGARSADDFIKLVLEAAGKEEVDKAPE